MEKNKEREEEERNNVLTWRRILGMRLTHIHIPKKKKKEGEGRSELIVRKSGKKGFPVWLCLDLSGVET